MDNTLRDLAHRLLQLHASGADFADHSAHMEYVSLRRDLLEITGSANPVAMVAREILATEPDPENLSVGDRVRHADGDGSVGTIVRFQAYPLATVRWESTGRESSVNIHYLIRVGR